MIVCDLLVRANGYWGDSCNGIIVGEARPDVLEMRDAAAEALAQSAEAMRPGARAGAVDAVARSVIDEAGFATPHHHIGHGVGTGSHEYPRIIPGADAELEANMVLCLEPGAYVPGRGGIRLETMFLVTDSGSVPLTPFQHRLQ
jgi:Xaa-Pro aminopeptidase